MSKQNFPITKEGMKKIEEELNQLIKVEREQLKSTIQEARELGDLKENAEYHSAKEKQSLVEGRIAYLQSVIANAQVVEVSQVKSQHIVFGATVKLIDTEEGEEHIFQIVGKDESDRSRGKISYDSPLGKALIGKEEGDTVVVKAPKGDIEYEVDSFEFK